VTDDIAPFSTAPELAVGLGSELSSLAQKTTEALDQQRLAFMKASGIALPVIRVAEHHDLGARQWSLTIGQEMQLFGLEENGPERDPSTAPAIIAERVLDVLKPLAHRFVTEEIVKHYLVQVAQSHPILVEATRTLVTLSDLTRELATRAARAESLACLPPVIDEIVAAHLH